MRNRSSCTDESTPNSSQVPQWALYGAAGIALVGAAGFTYYATIAESEALKKVKLTKEQRGRYAELMRRTGSPDPGAELDRIRLMFAKALPDDAEEPKIPLGAARIEIETDEGHNFFFPGNFFDRNADGIMDFGEFLVAYVILSEFFRPEMRPRTDVQKVVFAAMDEDCNGSIDKTELSHFMNMAMALGLVHGFSDTKAAVDHYLAMFDSNGDGRVDFGEFCALEKKALDYSRLMRNRAEFIAQEEAELRGLIHSRTRTAVRHQTSSGNTFVK